MKKFIALVLALITVFALSVPSFAVSTDSMTGKKVYKVIVRNGKGTQQDAKDATWNGNEVTIVEDADTNHVRVISNADKGTFNKWIIYRVVSKNDGSVAYEVATKGVDYNLISGSLTSKEIVVEPLNDLVFTGNYNGMITDPATGAETKDTSPKTNDVAYIFAFIALISLAGITLTSKKVSE